MLGQPTGALAIPLTEGCAVPEALISLPERLERVEARLQSEPRLRILAIGSSSTQGVGASSLAASYPARLAEELRRRLDPVEIEVINRGLGGELASSTAERMRSEVAATQPDLVIWQVGTNDAMTGAEQGAFRQVLVDTLDWLEAQGVDTVLMDPQYFPRIAEEAAYHRFVDDISVVAAVEGIGVMRRFAAMRHWATADAEAMLAADRFHLNDRGYGCVAEVLAEAIFRRIAAF